MINHFLTEQADRLDSQSALADMVNHFLTEQADRLDSQSALADMVNHVLTEQADRLVVLSGFPSIKRYYSIFTYSIFSPWYATYTEPFSATAILTRYCTGISADGICITSHVPVSSSFFAPSS